jgi:predicted molibdopterin-dependent oxidoreductase YjgC
MPDESVNLTVDGEAVAARPEETLLAVCRRLGKDIPTLCHHESLEPYAACRVCLVEVAAAGRTALVPSCQYPVSRDLAVRTDSPAVQSARRMVLELLLARCPASEVVRDLAARHGVTSSPYPCDDPKQTCILCGLCVRACEERMGASALGFSQRGVERQVGTPFGEPSDACVGCLACVAVCPTGHVRYRDSGPMRLMETWQTELALARCQQCGRFFAPERLLQYLRAKLPQHLAPPEVCDACRRRRTCQRLSECSTPLQASARLRDGIEEPSKR